MEIEQAMAILAEPNLNDNAVLRRLREAGFGEDDSRRIVALVPLAFGRALFSGERPTFCDYYEVDGATGRRQVAFSDEPIFVAAARLAEQWLTSGAQDRVRAIGVRSAEVNAVVQLTRDGSPVADIVLTAPLLLILGGDTAAPKPPKSPWWRFW
jgi:hypothetical protein